MHGAARSPRAGCAPTRRKESRDAAWWAGLAALFLFLSADEALGIHEVLIVPLRDALHASGVLYFAWVVPYSAFALVVALLYVRFLLRLPREIAMRFVTAGAIYVGGAVGLELVAGEMSEGLRYGPQSFPMELEYLVEETMEMVGAAYFVSALLRYFERGGDPLRVAAIMADAAFAEGTRQGLDR